MPFGACNMMKIDTKKPCKCFKPLNRAQNIHHDPDIQMPLTLSPKTLDLNPKPPDPDSCRDA